jgi:hypothetical protein
VLTAALSAILYKVSFRQSDTDPTKIERRIGRGAAARLFSERVSLLMAGLDDLGRERTTQPEVLQHDARKLGEAVPDGSATAIVTSPPYAGTYDYAETQRLRFDFLGIRHREMDEGEMGARRSFEFADAFGKWRADLAAMMGSIAAALAPRGLAAIVIGDSLAAGKPMHADDDVRGALDDRLGFVARAWQDRPALGGAERRAFIDRPKREHVILLERR